VPDFSDFAMLDLAATYQRAADELAPPRTPSSQIFRDGK
jgi:hypothetical protein